VHVDEDLAEAAVVVFAGAQVDLVAADDGLLGVALAAVRQLLAVARDLLDDPLDDLLGDLTRGAAAAPRPISASIGVVLVLVILDQRGGAAATAWSRRGRARWPSAPASRTACRRLAVVDVASLGMLIVLEIAPEMNGWAAAIMRMWLSTER
jgi:hypothetical protein